MDPPRQARALAVVAFLLLLTALLLPWWVVTWSDESGRAYDKDAVRPFGKDLPVAKEWARSATGILAATAALILMVRVAAGSHIQEPLVFRRDLALGSLLSFASLVTTTLWPTGGPKFWGGRSFEANDTLLVATFTEKSNPGLGFVLAAIAALLLLVAWTRMPGPTTRK